jgi:hypothetical protein
VQVPVNVPEGDDDGAPVDLGAIAAEIKGR